MMSLKKILFLIMPYALVIMLPFIGQATEPAVDVEKTITKRVRDSLWIPVEALVHYSNETRFADEGLCLPTKVLFDVMEDFHDEQNKWPSLDELIDYINNRKFPWNILFIEMDLRTLQDTKNDHALKPTCKKLREGMVKSTTPNLSAQELRDRWYDKDHEARLKACKMSLDAAVKRAKAAYATENYRAEEVCLSLCNLLDCSLSIQ